MSENEEPKVTIPREEYEELVAAREMLDALCAAGVDNWDGYDYACQILKENKKDK